MFLIKVHVFSYSQKSAISFTDTELYKLPFCQIPTFYQHTSFLYIFSIEKINV